MANDLSIDQLRSLVTIADTNSVTLAAQKLFRTQPALSLQIKRLEEQVGTPLLQRKGRNIEVTEAGQVLVEYARRILDLNEEAMAKLSLTDTEGKVRIGVLEEVAIGPLVDLLTKFGRLCAKVELELVVDTSWNLSEMIRKNDICLAVANLQFAHGNTIPLWEEQYVWVHNAEYDFTKEESIPVIMDSCGYPCEIRDQGLALLNSLDKPWHLVFSSYSLTALKAAIQAGLGIGFIAQSATTDDMCTLESSDYFSSIYPTQIGLYRSIESSTTAMDTLSEFLIDHLQAPQNKDTQHSVSS